MTISKEFIDLINNDELEKAQQIVQQDLNSKVSDRIDAARGEFLSDPWGEHNGDDNNDD